jgi:hypothetical protein
MAKFFYSLLLKLWMAWSVWPVICNTIGGGFPGETIVFDDLGGRVMFGVKQYSQILFPATHGLPVTS